MPRLFLHATSLAALCLTAAGLAGHLQRTQRPPRSDPAPPGLAPPNKLVNDPDGEALGSVQSEVALALRGDTLVASWNDSKGFVGPGSMAGFGTSTTRGDAWVDGGEIAEELHRDLRGDPSIVVTPEGTWIHACVEEGWDDGIALSRGRFRDGVLIWDASRVLILQGGEALDKPWLACDPATGRLALTFMNWSQNQGQLVVSDDRGESWSAPLPIFESARSNGIVSAIGPAGDIVVVWTDRMGEPSSIILSRASADGGASWSGPAVPITTLGPRSHEPPACFDREANPTFASIAASPVDGAFVVAWTDGEPSAFAVYASRSETNGQSWREPVRVDRAATIQPGEAFWPQIHIAPDGRVTMGWYDRRNDLRGETLTDYYVAQSLDGGCSWSRNRRLSDRAVAWCGVPSEMPPNFGDYLALSSDAHAIFAGWADARAGDPDVLFARFDDHPRVTLAVHEGLNAATLEGAAWRLSDEVRLPVPPAGAASAPLLHAALAFSATATPPERASLLELAGGLLEVHASIGTSEAEAATVLDASDGAAWSLDIVMAEEPSVSPETSFRTSLDFVPDGPGIMRLEGTITREGLAPLELWGTCRAPSGFLTLASLHVEQTAAVEGKPHENAWVRIVSQAMPHEPLSAGGPVAPPAPEPGSRAIVELRATPSPSWGGVTFAIDVRAATRLSLHVLDVSGREVHCVPERSFSAGMHTMRFGGFDDGGRALAPGVYFAVARAPSCEVRRKFVIAR